MKGGKVEGTGFAKRLIDLAFLAFANWVPAEANCGNEINNRRLIGSYQRCSR